MNDDISIGLLEMIQKSFNLDYEKSSKIKNCLKELEEKKADYSTAQEYAIEVGEILAKAFGNIQSRDLPNEKMYYNIARKLIEPTLTNNYELISDYSTQTQKILNKSANIGLTSISSELNENRIHGITWKISQADNFDDVKWMLNDPIIQFSQSVVDDTIKFNADMQYKSGRVPVIQRKVMGSACGWCMNLAGTYSYPDVPDNVYRRHRDCRCQVTYDPADGKYRGSQNVWSKKWSKKSRDDILYLERTSNNNIAYPLKAVPKRFQKYVPGKKEREAIIEEGVKLAKPIFMNDKAGTWANYIKPLDGVYDVVIHGNEYFMEYFGKKIDPDTLCAIISQRKDYKKNQPIRLISCNTGAKSDGVADYIAKKLHCKVYAPTTEAQVYMPINGVSEVKAERSPKKNDGKFILFDGTAKKNGK